MGGSRRKNVSKAHEETPAKNPYCTRSSVLHTPAVTYKIGGAKCKLYNNEEERIAGAAERKKEFSSLQGRLSREFWPKLDVASEETILQKLKEYRDKYRDTYFNKNDDDFTVEDDDDILQVANMSLEVVKKSDEPGEDFSDMIQVEDKSPEEIMSKIANLMATARDHGYPVQTRKANGCQKFSKSLDSWTLRYKKEYMRQDVTAGSQPYKRTEDLLTRIFKLCEANKHMQIREIYYTNKSLYKNEKTVTDLISDVCCMLRCTRNSLHVFASENGLIYGDISFKLDEEVFNCRSGRTIPPYSKFITDIESSNKDELYFILVVEKETVFQRLKEDKFCEKYHCIMITGKGMPSVETRIMLQKLSSELKLPVYALVDGNPYGLRIYSTYRYGSAKMSYDRQNLVTPNIELLGMQYSDIGKFDIHADNIEKLGSNEEVAARKLLGQDHLKAFHAELLSMIENKKMFQIEALYCHGLEFLAEVALPLLLDQKLTQLLQALQD